MTAEQMTTDAYLAGLYDYEPRKLAHAGDPDTSRAAAASLGNNAKDQRARILAALQREGPMDSERIGAHVGLTQVQTARRVSDLRNLGLVVDTGQRTLTRSGRAQAVWAAVTS